jgi:site-specific recombinase XerC
VCRCKFRDFWNITYKWLKKRKYIKQNPWLDVDSISVPKEQKSRTVTPPPDIVPRLLNAKYEHRYEFPIKEFVYGLYRTGARKEELLFIELDDVDWTTGKWTIQPKRCPTKFGMSCFKSCASTNFATRGCYVCVTVPFLNLRSLNNQPL